MKKLVILCIVTLLLAGCTQPTALEPEVTTPVDETEKTVEVASLDAESPFQQKTIIPPQDQTVKVIVTPEALDMIAQDLEAPNSRNKVLKIKPAID